MLLLYMIISLYPSHHHLNTSSKGRVSEKHESQTWLTTLVAWTSSLHLGRAITDMIARLRTQFWNCCVNFQLPRVKASRVHLHSPLNIDARIWGNNTLVIIRSTRFPP